MKTLSSLVFEGNSVRTSRKSTRVFYINIGGMPTMKAEAHVTRIKEEFLNSGLDEENYENFFIPVRDSESRVEVFQ